MATRFGTDGIRGHAGTEVTVALARALGAAAVRALGADVGFLVARDTRESGPALEAAFIEGVTASGSTARSLGVLPTPGLAAACAASGAAGAMVSASHNPYSDNGLKLFEPGGRKLRDATEAAVEAALGAVLDEGATGPGPSSDHPVGADDARAASDAYVAHLVAAAGGGSPFGGLHVVLDCANGAASEVAPRAMRTLGATVDVIGAAPDGRNINDGFGSNHPEAIAGEVVARGAAVGLAFDGDADRVVAVDAEGSLLDGDHILAILAIDMDARGALRHHAIATTVMANLGLARALASRGIEVTVTPVGDRHVIAAMEMHDLVLGGEQSGHVIAADYSVTGDGPLTGILLLGALLRSGEALASLASVVTKFPQILRNVRVADRAGLDDAREFWHAVHDAEAALGDTGRVLVRPSGTEPLVRVMVEAADEVEAERITATLVAELTRALGSPPSR